MNVDKKQYLLENGWWAHYNNNCWFESSEDEFWVDNNFKIVGFRPKSEGITLEEAFIKLKQNQNDESRRLDNI